LWGVTYTRYVDDLSFSSTKDFKGIIADLITTIANSSFHISYRKTFYQSNQTITGIDVFNNFIDVPERIKEKAAAEVEANDLSGPFTAYQKRVRQTNTNITPTLNKRSA
jgi:RNA-directed DNA polymerase